MGFLSYFKEILFFVCLLFVGVSFIVFFYFKNFIQAGQFLLKVFTQGEKEKSALSFLTHTRNPFLKKIQYRLKSFLLQNNKVIAPQVLPDPLFSDIVQKAVGESQKKYSSIKIHTQLISDISLPVFSKELLQALHELIKNSAQALSSHTEGQLNIRTFKKSTWFCCELEDNGPGMEPSVRKKALELYFSTKKQSVGLGLTFVHSVLSRIGGIVQLKPSQVGGLKVTLFIPLDYIAHIEQLKYPSQKDRLPLTEQSEITPTASTQPKAMSVNKKEKAPAKESHVT